MTPSSSPSTPNSSQRITINRMAINKLTLLFALICVSMLMFALCPQPSEAHIIRKKEIKALKKLAIAATVVGNKKKIMIPLPVPLPVPIPIIHKHEPIISPIDPWLTISAAKGAKGFHGGFGGGYGGGFGGFGGHGIGGLGGHGFAKRR